MFLRDTQFLGPPRPALRGRGVSLMQTARGLQMEYVNLQRIPQRDYWKLHERCLQTEGRRDILTGLRAAQNVTSAACQTESGKMWE